MISGLVAWSLQFFARIAVAALLGNVALTVVWGLIDSGDRRASGFPVTWLGSSLVVGGILLAVATVLFPGSKPAPGETLTQLAACLAACCLGCILVPVGVVVTVIRFFLP